MVTVHRVQEQTGRVLRRDRAHRRNEVDALRESVDYHEERVKPRLGFWKARDKIH